MTPDDEAAREIAGKLTKAQRALIVRGNGPTVTANKVFKIDPALVQTISGNEGWRWLSGWTDRGLRVRAILQEQGR